MLIDIHRHSTDNGEADLILRNVFHHESPEITSERYLSIGLHPWHVKESSLSKDIQRINTSATLERVLAIGETGIDRAINTDIEMQKEAFRQQIEIAKEVDKPMVIHCVRSYNELISFRKSSKHLKPWIIHWFNASFEIAEVLIQKNCYLSFGQILFKEKTKGFKSFCKIPLERIFFETDDTDVSISEIYERASEIRRIPQLTLQNQIKQNFENCFSISL